MLAHIVRAFIFLGFATITLLLATNHYGFAIKITNYFFWFVLLVVLGGLFSNEIKK